MIPLFVNICFSICLKLRPRPEAQGGWGGVPTAGDRFPPPCGGVLGWLAPVCGEGSEEVGKCPGKAHRSVGGGSHRPPLGQTWHPALTGKCCHTGEQGAQFPPSWSWWTWVKFSCNDVHITFQHQGGTYEYFSVCTISDLQKRCSILKYTSLLLHTPESPLYWKRNASWWQCWLMLLFWDC